ncbi:hypothetical protein V1669_13240 [Aeromonas enteropelogenes]|uniref:radical SAM protein n=1 Tax=Aeromonas enteropelogenes TaxID=29489 RepID=UPI003134BC7D
MGVTIEDLIVISPKTLTIIATYHCTAACADCCFECTPKITHRLSLAEILSAIDSAIGMYPDIGIVVFTGGECFTLKEDLFTAIKHCTSNGLQTRCVTNAYWAKNYEMAVRYAEKLIEAGICEINISTGLDHQRWVSEKTVLNAVLALTKRNIFTLLTVEKDTNSSSCFESIQSNKLIMELQKNNFLFKLQSNSWMTFSKDSVERELIDRDAIDKGCDQIFENIVITPKKKISACCGLTLEHINEMKVGDINDLSGYVQHQKNDFLKLWIKIDGPIKIIDYLLGEGNHKTKNVSHQCEACAMLHKDPEIIRHLKSRYQNYIPYVLNKYLLIKSATSNQSVSRGYNEKNRGIRTYLSCWTEC